MMAKKKTYVYECDKDNCESTVSGDTPALPGTWERLTLSDEAGNKTVLELCGVCRGPAKEVIRKAFQDITGE